MNKKYSVVLQDTKTKEFKKISLPFFLYDEHEKNGIDFMWYEGNYSCDCNRGDFFYQGSDEEFECTGNRFKLLDIIF